MGPSCDRPSTKPRSDTGLRHRLGEIIDYSRGRSESKMNRTSEIKHLIPKKLFLIKDKSIFIVKLIEFTQECLLYWRRNNLHYENWGNPTLVLVLYWNKAGFYHKNWDNFLKFQIPLKGCQTHENSDGNLENEIVVQQGEKFDPRKDKRFLLTCIPAPGGGPIFR